MSEAARARFIEPMQNDAGTWGVDIGGHWLPCDGESEEEVRATAQRVAQRIDAYAAEQTAWLRALVEEMPCRCSEETFYGTLVCRRCALHAGSGNQAMSGTAKLWTALKKEHGQFVASGAYPARHKTDSCHVCALLADSGQAGEPPDESRIWHKAAEIAEALTTMHVDSLTRAGKREGDVLELGEHIVGALKGRAGSGQAEEEWRALVDVYESARRAPLERFDTHGWIECVWCHATRQQGSIPMQHAADCFGKQLSDQIAAVEKARGR